MRRPANSPNLKKIEEYVDRSLMLVTALSPVIGYDKASRIAHYAMDNDLTLKEAALKLGFVSEAEFDRMRAISSTTSGSSRPKMRGPLSIMVTRLPKRR
jgi:fumarate hydratase class II